MRGYVSMPKNEDLVVLKELIESGKVTPVIDRTYSLSETPKAIGYLGEGHTQGKVVITVQPNNPLAHELESSPVIEGSKPDQ